MGLLFFEVRWHGLYHRAALDEILDRVQVGIVPSLCEEVYGYVGVEFLAKGIPVIGNRRGGIVDYTIDGQTGWLNKSCTAGELADIMEKIIKEPASILPVNRWILAHRDSVIADRAQHLTTVSLCYGSAIEKHRRVSE